MTRLEQLLLFILDRAQKEGKTDLSKFQLFKIPYLLQVYSIKYAGVPLVTDTTFIRESNGPISVDIYSALKKLEKSGYILMTIKENPKYGHEKHAFSLNKKIPELKFTSGEIIFLDNFLSELLPLTQAQLKQRAYSTEPMLEIQEKEKDNNILLKGAVINFSSVSVDSDVVDAYSDLQ